MTRREKKRMFSLMFKMMKLVAALFACLVLLVLALNFQLAYLGDGRFEVRAKSSWRLADTLLWKPDATAEASVPLASAPRQLASASASPSAPGTRSPRALSECAGARDLLEKAVTRWNGKYGTATPMAELDLFGLIEAECLEAMPACPAGGDYQLFYAGGVPRVRCTVHGLARPRP